MKDARPSVAARRTLRTSLRSFGTSTRASHDASKFYARRLYERAPNDKTDAPASTIPPHERDRIYHHDARAMAQLPDNAVALMVTSPPYNVGKDYDEDLSLSEYRSLLKDVLAETYRVLLPGGRACVNVANVGRRPYIPLNAIVAEIASELGFLMRGEIIWNKGASAGASCAWGSWRSASNPVLRDVHEYVLVFSKGDYKRSQKGKASIGRDEFLENTKSLWTFPTTSARKAGHPAPFPLELPRRLIELYTYIGDVVLDPFMGSGTTACAALQTQRHYVGYELQKKYITLARHRIQSIGEAQKPNQQKS